MVWLLIIVIVGLVFAPAMWLRPTRGQQRIRRLREAAMKAGVTVRLEKPPLHEEGAMPAYRWPYPTQLPGPDFVLVREGVASPALKPFIPGWRWRIEPLRVLPAAELQACLVDLPDDALLLESGQAALTLWWEESLDAEAFLSCQRRLATLRDALSGRPDRPARRAVPSSPP